MKVLVTGAKGFIGKNLTARLRSSAGFVPVENIENDCVILKDATPWAAAGQHLVLYDGNGVPLCVLSDFCVFGVGAGHPRP